MSDLDRDYWFVCSAAVVCSLVLCLLFDFLRARSRRETVHRSDQDTYHELETIHDDP